MSVQSVSFIFKTFIKLEVEQIFQGGIFLKNGLDVGKLRVIYSTKRNLSYPDPKL
jgi:hypothetical protein